MMARLRSVLSRLPIKWKMVLWSSFILFVFFAAYNIAQYVAIDRWMFNREEAAIQKKMAQLQDYYQEKKTVLNTEQIKSSQSFLEKMNDTKELIRILDSEGLPIVTVSNDLPADRILPQISEQTMLLSVWHGTDHVLVMRSPLVSEHFRGTIEIVHNLETADQLSDAILFVMVAAGAGAILLSGFGGMVLARQLLKPIQTLAGTIQSIKRRGLQERVAYEDNNDELSHLAMHFNELMDQLETSFRKQQQFVEDASHELRTPLSIMKGHLSLLQRWGKSDPEALDVSLQAALQEFDRMEGIVQELLALTRAESEQPAEVFETVNCAAFVRQSVARFSALHPASTFEAQLESVEDETIRVVPYQLEQILLILLDNAVKYSADRPVVQIVGTKQDRRVHISVIDFGIGIPAADLPHVCDRFYRVDKARSRERGGTGLGLAIAKRLVERNRGEISITSVERQGTTVTLSFPAASET